MKKRGISHIEVILSFVLFITAVGFGLYFFNSGDSTRFVSTTISYAFREIEKNTSTSLEFFSVNVNGALIMSNEIALDFSGVTGDTTILTYDGRILNSSRGGTNGELVYISSPNWGGEDFIYVVFGEEFSEDTLSETEGHNETYYRIGSSETRDVISERKFKMLNQAYYADYRGLKSQSNFNLPDRADFGFSLEFDNGEAIVAENSIPDNFEIFSEKKRVEVLREDGSVTFADLIVKVW